MSAVVPITRPPSGYYHWAIGDKPISIRLSIGAAKRLHAAIAVSESQDIRTPESGGILLGRTATTPDGSECIIDDWELIPSEHLRSASYTLSMADKQSWAKVLSRSARSGARVPVGWFRTHTRPGLYLDEYDFELFRTFFAHPASAALLIRPDEGASTAGFFFWENGEIQRATSYRTFSFPPDASDTPVSVPEPAPALQPAAVITAAVKRPSVPARPNPITRPNPIWLWAPVTVGVLAGLFWDPTALRREKPVAASTDRPVFQPTRESEYPVPPAPIPLVYEPEAVVPTVQNRNRELPKPVRPVELPPLRQPARTAPRMEMPSAPELTAVARLDRPPLIPERKLLAETAVEPAKPSAIRRAVGSIPGLGFLKRRKKDFIAPRAIRQVRPTVPGLVADNDPVRVKVLVDEQGNVADAELVTRKSDPKLAALAIEAAREWQFKPATVNEKPVETELILQFRFPAGAND